MRRLGSSTPSTTESRATDRRPPPKRVHTTAKVHLETTADGFSIPASFPIRAMTFPTHSASGRWWRGFLPRFVCNDVGLNTHLGLCSTGVSVSTASNQGRSGMLSPVSFFCIAAGISRTASWPTFQTGADGTGLVP